MLNHLQEITYSDIDVLFKPHPETKALPKLKNERAISRSIKNIVLSNKYEHFYRPDLYSNVTGSLFENMGSVEISVLENNVRRAINNFEPRAIVNDVVVREIDNGFTMSISFTPITSKNEVRVELFIERLR